MKRNLIVMAALISPLIPTQASAQFYGQYCEIPEWRNSSYRCSTGRCDTTQSYIALIRNLYPSRYPLSDPLRAIASSEACKGKRNNSTYESYRKGVYGLLRKELGSGGSTQNRSDIPKTIPNEDGTPFELRLQCFQGKEPPYDSPRWLGIGSRNSSPPWPIGYNGYEIRVDEFNPDPKKIKCLNDGKSFSSLGKGRWVCGYKRQVVDGKEELVNYYCNPQPKW